MISWKPQGVFYLVRSATLPWNRWGATQVSIASQNSLLLGLMLHPIELTLGDFKF